MVVAKNGVEGQARSSERQSFAEAETLSLSVYFIVSVSRELSHMPLNAL